MKRIIILIFVVFLMASCSKIRKTPKLLVLKRVSDGQERIAEQVLHQDEMFEALLVVVKNDNLKNYQDGNSIRKNFGNPVYIKDVMKNGQKLQQWLYRYQTKYFNVEKVYLFFNEAGKLVDHLYIPIKEKGHE